MKILVVNILLLMASFMHAQSWPGTPKEIVEAKGVSVPVYDFSGFKELLEMKGDNTFVINFWATWCKPCVDELPHFTRLASEMEVHGVEFIFVSLDFRKSLEERVIPFALENGMSDRLVMLHDPDANSWIRQVDKSWTGAIPATLIYNSLSREFHEEKLDYETLKTIVQSLKNSNHE